MLETRLVCCLLRAGLVIIQWIMCLRFLDDSLIPSDPDTLPSAYSNDASTISVEVPPAVPWLLPGEADMKPYEFMPHISEVNAPQFYEGQDLPGSLSSLDPVLLSFLSQNEMYLRYIFKEDGVTIDEDRLQQVIERMHQLQPTSYAPAYQQSTYQGVDNARFMPQQGYGGESFSSGAITSSGSGAIYGNQSWQAIANQNMYNQPPPPQVNPINTYNPTFSANTRPPQQHSMPSLDFSISVPSLSEISTVRQPRHSANEYVPPSQSGKPVDHKRGKKSIPCRLFNSPDGCRFGDKCDFSHSLAGNEPAHVSAPVRHGKGGKPGNRQGPGGRR
jgi:hypothetical protein